MNAVIDTPAGTASATDTRRRLSISQRTKSGRISLGDTFSTLSVVVTDADTGEPVPSCVVDFTFQTPGSLERMDDGFLTDADGVARATFLALAEGNCTIKCLACCEQSHPAELDVSFVILPAAPPSIRSFDALDAAMDAALRGQKLVDVAIKPAAPGAIPDADGLYGTRESRDSVIETVDPPYVIPIDRSQRYAALALMLSMACLSLYLAHHRWLSSPAEVVCHGRSQGTSLVYACVSK